MSNIKVDYDILNQKQTPAFYASSLATRPAFGFPGRIFIDTDTPSSGIYRDTGSAWVQVADPGAGTTGTLQQVTTNGNTTTNSIQVQGIDFSDGAGTGGQNIAIGASTLSANTTGYSATAIGYQALQNNTTGNENIGIGAFSLKNNTIGNYNIAIGLSSLISNISGSSNTSIGYGGLSANTTGSNNTAIGINALATNTTPSQNTAIGANSLSYNTTGANNTAIGGASLTANTTGGSNTAIGYNSLQANTTASFNTAIGTTALGLNTTGANNTAIGYASLFSNTTASNNVAIGYASLNHSNTGVGAQSLNQNTTGSTNTAIGTASMTLNTTGASNTAIGSSALQNNTTGSQNIAIGTNSLIANTTASGNTAIGYSSLLVNTTGNQNVAIGNSSLQNNTTAICNTAIGYFSLSANTTGNNNTGIGTTTLFVNTTGSSNTAIGISALAGNTTGQLNTAIGYGSGSAITTGNNNTILGAYTGTATLTNNIVLSDGSANVRLFSDANGLIGINQAVGSTIGGQLDIHTTQTYALVLNGLSTSNAYTAFSNNSVGKWRIGNTYNAGANSFDIFNLGTSSNALSFNSTTNAVTFSSGIATLGYTASTSYAALFNGLVGIGTNAPSVGLSIQGTTSDPVTIQLKQNAAGGRDYRITSRDDGSLRINDDTAGSERMRISLTGNVLIGTATDDTVNKLQVNGGVKISTASTSGFVCNSTNNASFHGFVIENNGIAVAGMETNANNGEIKIGGYQTTSDFFPVIYSDGVAAMTFGLGGSITITIANLAGTGSRAVLADANGLLSAPVSDISVKENINTIGYGLNDILKMNPVWFYYNNEYKNYGEGRQNGNIAQEMETIIPEAVFTTPSTGKMGINYDQLHAVYIKAIQELNEKLVRNNIN